MTKNNTYTLVEISRDGSVWNIKGAKHLTLEAAKAMKEKLEKTMNRYSMISIEKD